MRYRLLALTQESAKISSPAQLGAWSTTANFCGVMSAGTWGGPASSSVRPNMLKTCARNSFTRGSSLNSSEASLSCSSVTLRTDTQRSAQVNETASSHPRRCTLQHKPTYIELGENAGLALLHVLLKLHLNVLHQHLLIRWCEQKTRAR
jgi:hypothetical protein